MVGCVEQCSNLGFRAFMDVDTTAPSSASFLVYPATGSPAFSGTLTLLAADVYRTNPTTDATACNWKAYTPAMYGESTGSAVPDNGLPTTHTFQPLSFFTATAVGHYTGSTIAMTNNGDGTWGKVVNALLTACGYDNSGDTLNGAVFVFSMADSAGNHYTAAGVYSTCF
jgi:hypothetical protein